MVRPRGWHLPEKHILVDGEQTSGGLVDFALYLATCGQQQIDRGQGPYFYLPKMESHLEARLWNDAFNLAQDFLGIPRGTIRATVLIETYPAAFEMEEILYELREHSAGLNAGRWDYMFSVIKSFRTRGKEFLLPDRNSVTMTVPFMRAYTELLVRTCHKRGAHAIGGMAAFIPSKDPEVNEDAFAKVKDDKTREANDGFDGSWVAHPGMVEACREAFTAVLGDRPNQIDKLREDVQRHRRRSCSTWPSTPGEVTEAGPAQQHQRRHPVPRVLAARLRRGRHQQPDGGRRHRRDLPQPGVAVAAQRRRARRRPDRSPASWSSSIIEEEMASDPRAGRRRRVRAGPLGRRPGHFHRDGAGRRVPRLPHPPGLRADALTGAMSGTHGTHPDGGTDRRRR